MVTAALRVPLRRSNCFVLVLVAIFVLGLRDPAFAQSTPRKSKAAEIHLVSAYVKLPLSFEPNQGQWDTQIRFVAHGAGYSLSLTDREAIFGLSKRAHDALPGFEHSSLTTDLVRMQLVEAQTGVSFLGENRLPGTVNYFTGTDRNNWHSGIPTFETVRLRDIYTGIDLVYHGNQRQLEFDFVVAPNASAKHIRIRFDGADSLRLDDSGNLILSKKNGELALRSPAAYQKVSGIRQNVKARFRLFEHNTVGFSIGEYDHSRELIVDPVLVYSTYLGGSFFDSINALAVDAVGNAYVTGNADSSNFPTTPGAYATSPPGTGCIGNYVFATKIDPGGSALLYSTYIGPGTGTAIAVDAAGDAYVVGSACSGFPVTSGAFQTANNAAANGGINGFVTKLNPNGTSLMYSTYLGGSWGGDQINAIAVDASGNAYLAGTANSPDFPTTPGAFRSSGISPGNPGSVVGKLDATGSVLVYSTYLLGNGIVSPFGTSVGVAHGIAIDSLGNAYVVGATADQSFPTTPGAFQTSYSTDPSNLGLFRFAGYVTKINTTGTQLLYSSYLGGSYEGEAEAVAVDSTGNAYVTGWTAGHFAVTPNAFQPQGLGLDAFVTKINPDGTSLLYSSYLGGSCQTSGQLMGDTGFAIAIDASGDAYVAGQACSQDFPLTTGAIQTGKKAFFFDAFLTEVNPAATSLLYSTYLGGSGNLNTVGDWANGIGLDVNGNVFVAGLTHSGDFPTVPGSLQLTNNASDGGAGFVAKVSVPSGAMPLVRDFAISLTPVSISMKAGQSAMTTITITPQNGFYQQISLTCSGLPSNATCAFSPSTVQAGPNTVTSTLTIQTYANVANVTRFHLYASSLALVLCFLCKAIGSRERSRSMLLTAVIIGASNLGGCGGGGGGGNASGGTGGTSPQQFTVSINATATSVQHSAILALTVN